MILVRNPTMEVQKVKEVLIKSTPPVGPSPTGPGFLNG
jgi:hypothetical protein